MGKNVVNIHEAKTNLSRIVEEVAAGAEVIIAKAGKPMALLSPIKTPVKTKETRPAQGQDQECPRTSTCL